MNERFREQAQQAVEIAARYLDDLETRRVLPQVTPGFLREQLPRSAPEAAEPLEQILADLPRLIEPGLTHWQHPGFMAYFPSSAPEPAILGEWLATVYNSNVMLWRNAPASTELEEVTIDWLRQLYGLPVEFDGMYTDTASTSSLLAIVAARESVAGLNSREEGLAGRDGIGRLRLYCSDEAHSSIEKGAIVAGIGRRGVRRIPSDDRLALIPAELTRAIEQDRAAGWWPCCVVGVIGTTSSTAIDPIEPIAEICERERIWLHVDAAYAGTAAILPEMRHLFRGWERADSIVINPHKWMMTPFDASILLSRRFESFRDSFSLTPEYLRVRKEGEAHDFHEYGFQLGRRFRALKLWILLRAWGAEGLRARLREHLRLAKLFAAWVEADPEWELAAPAPFSTVCFRHRQGDEASEKIMQLVNAEGAYFLSHAKLRGRYTIRLALGNVRQEERHLSGVWGALQRAAAQL